jgi:hypothetical protein
MYQTEEKLDLGTAEAANTISSLRGEPLHREIVSLDKLFPLTKVWEPTLFSFVKDSLDKYGLYNPLVVRKITVEEWEKELELDVTMLPPPKDKGDNLLMIQCGCNRFFALKELGYSSVECYIVEDKKQAQELCHVLRVDRTWKKNTLWSKKNAN